ncbi:unnamed protein product [Pleuronectes platessa]|uniref:MIF4G domain-containing protein n=1 Tax=Pleuronectes platessa TaxID=8262 RepID=A0A9N7YBN8_PLEPL|nr:unnamed protein product [Pleuronectes platessa]
MSDPDGQLLLCWERRGRWPRDTEPVVFLEASCSSKKPWNPADQGEGKRRRIPSEPVVFLGAASYKDQPQVDITLGAPSILMIETTEDEDPAASEEAVRKEQVRPEESVSCITENFQAFMTDLSHEELDGEESLQEMVELVFKRALQKPHSAAVFAELCQHLNTSVSFRSLLVKHCQAEFRKNCDCEGNYQKSGFCLEPVRDVRFIAQLREQQKNAKHSGRFLNTIRFIGELFLSKVLAEKAMHCCIRRLLQKGDGPSLESLCELLQLIHQDLEVVTSKEVMDSYNNQLDFIAEKGKRAPRLSLLLKHTADSRKCRGWGSSRPPLHASGDPACSTSRRFFCPLLRCLTASVVRGLSFSWTAGWCPSPVRKAGRWRGPGTAVGGSDSGRVSGPSRGSPQLRRSLGEPSVRAGAPPLAVRLGWRLAADSGADQGNPTIARRSGHSAPHPRSLAQNDTLPRDPAHLILLPADELPEPSATPSSCSPASPFLLKNSRSHQHSLVLPSGLSPALKNSRSHQHPVYPPCPTLNKHH